MSDTIDIQTEIQKTINENPVVLFMKGNTHFPQCGFSGKTVHILQALNVEFVTVDVLADDSVRQGIKSFSNWPTVPQLYVNGAFVGGCDIVSEMYETGELQNVFTPA